MKSCVLFVPIFLNMNKAWQASVCPPLFVTVFSLGFFCTFCARKEMEACAAVFLVSLLLRFVHQVECWPQYSWVAPNWTPLRQQKRELLMKTSCPSNECLREMNYIMSAFLIFKQETYLIHLENLLADDPKMRYYIYCVFHMCFTIHASLCLWCKNSAVVDKEQAWPAVGPLDWTWDELKMDSKASM